MKPRARSQDLIVEALDDELLVFDQQNQECHVLNRAAAAVWRRCDGRTDVPKLAAAASEASGLPLGMKSRHWPSTSFARQACWRVRRTGYLRST